MPEDKEDQLWQELKEEAKRHGFGELCIKFKVHQGRIVGAETMPETKKVWKV